MSIASGLTVVTISSLPFSETWTAVRVSVWYYILLCLSFSVLSRMPESVSLPQSALSCSRDAPLDAVAPSLGHQKPQVWCL